MRIATSWQLMFNPGGPARGRGGAPERTTVQHAMRHHPRRNPMNTRNPARECALAAFLLLVAPTARAAPTYPAVTTPDGRQKTSALVENAGGVLWDQSNAMGPVSLRAGVTATINSVRARDSTIVLETRGATRLGCWLYAIPDSGVHTDSTRVALFGVTFKVHRTSAPDSGVSAMPLSPMGVRSIVDTVATGRYTPSIAGLLGPYAYMVAGLAAENTDITRTLMPGEVVVPLLSFASFGLGMPRARYFEISASDYGWSSLPSNVSLVVRFLGHSDVWPPALIRLPTRRVNTRLDVQGLK